MDASAWQVRVFLNARSGSGSVSAEQLCALFAQHGCACVVTALGPDVDVARMSREESEAVKYVAAGGDGTVSCVAGAVAGTQRSFGVLPCGTLNHFAKDLGLPLQLNEAVKIAAGATTRQVDVGEVNGRVFVNNSSLGFYPAMVSDRERMKHGGWNKWASLVVASLRAFVRFKCAHVELDLQDQGRRCVTPFLFVGNNRYCMEGLQLGQRERLDSARLALYLAPGANRVAMLRMALAAVLGRMKREPTYEEIEVEAFTAKVRGRRLRVSLDGEVERLAGPLRYRIRPGALRVLCRGDEAR